MTETATGLRLHTTSGEAIDVDPAHLVVAGYTGRDRAAVRHHIEELAAIGVPEPDTIPAFFELAPDRLTTNGEIEVGGDATSGEVEPVMIRWAGRQFLAVGSDHTDREIERTSIHDSKAACSKPISSTVVELGTPLSARDWDSMVVRCWVDGELYQEGRLAALLPITQVLAAWDTAHRESAGDRSLVLFGGTLPLLGGSFRYGRQWRVQLASPYGPPVELSYSVTVRSPDAQ